MTATTTHHFDTATLTAAACPELESSTWHMATKLDCFSSGSVPFSFHSKDPGGGNSQRHIGRQDVQLPHMAAQMDS